jgi:outer membrane protein
MKIKLTILGILMFTLQYAIAQEKKDSVMRFSLAEAKDYALKNSPVVKNSALDLDAAKKKIWETTAIGLPQVGTKLSYSYMPQLSSTLQEFSGFGNLNYWLYNADQYLKANDPSNHAFGNISNPGTPTPISLNDLKWSLNWDITVTQIIFSGAYIVGLQTSKIYKGLSEYALSKSKDDLNESVTNAYILVLVASENEALLDSTYLNTLQILNDMKKISSQGMIDETDVDQLQLTTNTLKSAEELLSRQADIAERMLKFQLGLDLNTKIFLVDSINGLIKNFENNNLLIQNFDLESNVDFKLVDTQAKLMKMNLLLNKSAFLPDIAAYYQHEKPFNTNALNFNPTDIIGVSLSWSIFTSGQRLARISQARYGYQKALNSKQQASDGLKLSYDQNKSNYLSSLDKYNTASENLKLAEKIYNHSLIKYKEGVISSTELSQTQNQYLQSQTNYFSSILELTSAKAKLEKLLSPIQ